ncbi:MAG: hypothetical protein WC444_01035 [Candidatus Paceibacterota bacterium]
MEALPKNGLGILSQNEIDLEKILEMVPVECRGLRFERVMRTFHPQEVTSMLELGFAIEWAQRNNGANNRLLGTFLQADEDDPRKNSIPCTAREWEVAELVAATMVRWLPTAVGCSFLQAAFKQGGGSMNYTLPDPAKGIPSFPSSPPEAVNDPGPITGGGGDENDGDDDWPMT